MVSSRLLFFLRQLVHQIQHQFFKDDAEAAGAHIALDRVLAAMASRASSVELQFDVLILEQPLVLFD